MDLPYMGKLFGFLVAVVGLVAGGIAIYQFAFPEPTPPPPPTSTPTLSFLEQVEGKYVLASWTKANRPIELGAKITDGTLQIDSSGIADWDVTLEQEHTSNPGRVRMTARGKLQISSKQIEGVQGGEFNNTHYLDAKWGQVSPDVTLAVRGWDYSDNDNFTVSLDNRSDGTQLLEMKNSRGTYTWSKQ
jgi:hypothetical protein